MRLPSTLATAVLSAGPAAWGADIPLRADVRAVTLSPAGAEIVRGGEARVPAGTHRLLIPLPGPDAVPEVRLTGAALDGVSLLPDAGLDLEALDTEEQATARTALEGAETRLREAQRAVEAARGAVRAAEIRLRWLETLTGGGEGGLGGPEDGAALAALLDTLAAQTAEATADRVAAQAEVEAAERARADARDAVDARRADLDRLHPLAVGTPVLALDVEVAAEGPVAVALERRRFEASWSPAYEMRLDTESETLALERLIRLRQDTGEVWRDVALTLSTADAARGTDPAPAEPDPARAGEVGQFGARADGVAVEEALVVEGDDVAQLARTQSAAPIVQGLAVSYAFPQPVTLYPGSPATLTLDEIALDVTTELRAVPRRDRHAFLMATATNPTVEPILPGPVTLLRDGARIGERALPLLAPGAEAEIGFGPVDTIRLTWLRLERGEGDAGLFRRASTLREAVAFTVENTGTGAAEVNALYALPFSEQEDVSVEIRVEPRPDQFDWEDRRGVAAWRLRLTPGESERVEMVFEIDWPEGQTLFWQP